MPRPKRAAKARRKTARKSTAGKRTAGKARKAKRPTRKVTKKATKRRATRKAARRTVRKQASKRKATKKKTTKRKATKKKTIKRKATKKKTIKKKATKRKVTGKKPASKKTAAPAARPGSGVRKARKKRPAHTDARRRELQAMLETRRVEIIAEIKRARQDSVESNRTSFAEVGDLVSASVEKERAFEYGEAGVQALREIDNALEKLKSGTYGFCEMCRKVIGIKRLKVMPSARLCIRCKSKEEASGGGGAGRSDR